jgi:hypothetical protein
MRDGYLDNHPDAMWVAMLIMAAGEAREPATDPGPDC